MPKPGRTWALLLAVHTALMAAFFGTRRINRFICARAFDFPTRRIHRELGLCLVLRVDPILHRPAIGSLLTPLGHKDGQCSGNLSGRLRVLAFSIPKTDCSRNGTGCPHYRTTTVGGIAKPRLTRKTERAPPTGWVRLSQRTPIKYQPGTWRATKRTESNYVSCPKAYFSASFPGWHRIRNSSKVGAMTRTLRSGKLNWVGNSLFLAGNWG